MSDALTCPLLARAFDQDKSGSRPSREHTFAAHAQVREERENTRTERPSFANSHLITHLSNPPPHPLGVCVYDVTNPGSFASVEKWLRELRGECPNAVIALLGNKTDLAAKRVITLEQAGRFCKQHNVAAHFECSALTGDGVEAAFQWVASAVAQQHDRQQRSKQLTSLHADDETETETETETDDTHHTASAASAAAA